MKVNQITDQIIQAGIEVHRTLGGPGLLECVYEEALVFELENRGLHVQRQINLPIHYKGNELANPLRIDLIVEDAVIIECKATSENHPIFEAQLLTYLRLSRKSVGLVLNFGRKYLKDGIHRVVNGLNEHE
ncbi:MAG: GxxExxY protein [Verrucomicrobiota bacterium]